jgi:Rieske Fe-S protein
MKLSRRELAGAALTTMAAAVAGRAQTPLQSAPLSPEAELQAAKLQVQAAAQALSQFEIPMDTEPAFAFQA